MRSWKHCQKVSWEDCRNDRHRLSKNSWEDCRKDSWEDCRKDIVEKTVETIDINCWKDCQKVRLLTQKVIIEKDNIFVSVECWICVAVVLPIGMYMYVYCTVTAIVDTRI